MRNSSENLLLRRGFHANRRRLTGKVERIVFEPGRQFWRTGQPTSYALFPLQGILSLQLSPASGKQVEVAVLGRQGFAGISLLSRWL